MKSFNFLMIAIFAAILGFFIFISIRNATTISVIGNCKVLDLQQQQIIKKTTTDIRYLVITDKETFVVKNSIVNGKFNNSDVFFRLKKGGYYNFTVSGNGKSIIFDYKNILEANQITGQTDK